MKTWSWALQYGLAIILALMLGAILGSISLFKETGLGTTGLTASDVVRFLGYGSALLLLWLLGHRATTQLPENVKALLFLRRVVVPLATLIVILAGYRVLLLLVDPFLEDLGITIYNWAFVLGIIGSALWLALTCYRSSSLLIEAFTVLHKPEQLTPSQTSVSCPKCGLTISASMKFCNQCGQSLSALFCQNCGQPLSAGQKFCAACGKAT